MQQPNDAFSESLSTNTFQRLPSLPLPITVFALSTARGTEMAAPLDRFLKYRTLHTHAEVRANTKNGGVGTFSSKAFRTNIKLFPPPLGCEAMEL